MSPSHSLYRGFVRVLAATSAALAAVTTASLVLQYGVVDTAADRGVLVAVMVLNLLGAPAAAALSLALAWRSWDREDARSLATFLAMAAFVLAADGMWNLLAMTGVPEWAASTAELSIPLCALAGMAAMLRFSCTFPRSLAPAELAAADGGSRARRLLAAAQRGSSEPAAVRRACAWAAGLLILAPHAVWLAATAWGRPFPMVGVLKYVLLAMVVGSMAVSAANLRAGYRVADAEGRRRVFWVLEGFLLATAVAVVASALKLLQDVTGYAPPLRFWYGLAMMAAFTALLACLAIAMFYAGALDPGARHPPHGRGGARGPGDGGAVRHAGAGAAGVAGRAAGAGRPRGRHPDRA